MMVDAKLGMEEECQRLQENLSELTENRAVIQEEFAELNEMHRQLIVQLRGDTLAGEGQLHAFQSEKRRIEERLEELERQLSEKNEKLLELDQKASEYLMKVTTASNTLYDDDDTSEQNESNKNLVQQLLIEALAAGKEEEGSSESPESEEGGSEGDESDTENVSFKLKVNDESVITDPQECYESRGHGNETDEEENTNEMTPPTKEQMLSLSSVVSELQRLKDEMGRCMSSKDETMTELEGQLLATKKELAFLRGSMSDMSFEIHRREEGYQSSERERSLDRRSMSDEENVELIQKLNDLESMAVEDRVELDELLLERRSSRGASRERSPTSHRSGIRSPSYTSISGRVAMLEKELNDAHEKLSKNQRRMRVLAMEREHKQKECDILQRKVNNVESKMSELQGTFDVLVRAMVAEKDDLVKRINEKDAVIEELKEKEQSQAIDLSLYILKEQFDSSVQAIEQKYCDKLSTCQNSYEELVLKHSKEVQSLKESVNISNEQSSSVIEELKNQVKQLESDNKSVIDKLRESREETDKRRKECIEMKSSLDVEKDKNFHMELELESNKNENANLLGKCSNLESKMADAALPLQEEVKELQNNLTNIFEEKNELESRLNSLQNDQENLLKKNEELSSKVEQFEKDSLEYSSMEMLKQQLEEQQQKLTDLNSMNDNLNSKINNKDQEIREELNAREATIQELRITLTNNQKQSRENYQMLQDDMAALQIRHTKEKGESTAVINHLKDKLIKAEEDLEKKQLEVDNLNKQLDERGPEVASQGTTTEEGTEIASQSFATEEGTSKDFEGQMESKVERINELEEKVNQLETNLEETETTLEEKAAKVQELEIKLREFSSQENPEEHYKSRFEEQIAQIKKLQNYIDTLKSKVDALSEESASLKQTVNKLQSERENIEVEKNSLEKELEEVKNSCEIVENDLETKKNLVKQFNFKLSSIEGLFDTPCDVNFSLIDRLDKVEERIQTSVIADNEKYLTKINDLEKEIISLKLEKCTEISSGCEESLLNQITDLKTRNRDLIEEKNKLTRQYEYEQNKTLEMQNEMVSDLEKLILNLEKEKKDLEAELQQIQIEKTKLESELQQVQIEKTKLDSELHQTQNRLTASAAEYENTLQETKNAISIVEKERDVFRQEVQKSKGSVSGSNSETLHLIEDLTKKLNLLRIQHQETEDLLRENELAFEEQLLCERAVYEKRLENLRRDLREEMDILEQQKDDVRQEMRWEMERCASDWANRLEASEKEKSIRLLEEKAQFGRVLVGKNDAYEKLSEERKVEIKGYQDRLTDLQAQLEEKTNVIDELETNLDEIVGVRSNLEEKLNLLKDALLTSKVDGLEGAAMLGQLLKSVEKKVQEMELSNADLRQKIDGLQTELSYLEKLAKDGNSSEQRLMEERKAVEDEKRAVEKEKNLVEEEKKVIEEEMGRKVSHLMEQLKEMKELENEHLDQISRLQEAETRFSDQILILKDKEQKYESDIAGLSEKEVSYLTQIKQFSENDIRITAEISRLQEDSKSNSDTISELEEKENNYLKQIANLNESLKQRNENNETNEVLEREIKNLEEELTKERSKSSTLALELKERNSQKENLTNDLETQREQRLTEIDSMNEQMRTLVAKVTEQEELVRTLKQSLGSVKEQLDTKEELAADIGSQLQEKEDLLQTLTKALCDLTQLPPGDPDTRDIINIIKRERENLKQEVDREISQKESLRIDLNCAKNELEKLYSEVKCKEDENSELTKEVELQKMKIIELTEKSNRILSEEKRTNSSLESKEAQMIISEEALRDAVENCKIELKAEYDEKLKELQRRHEEERERWKEKNERKEEEMRAKIQALTLQSNNEKKELEKLTRVAANAFKSGTESVDLLKEQVLRQRMELEEAKRNHKKELEEFQLLLDVKRRKGRGDRGEMRNVGSLEDAAEFEYLRNILYQYMIGKETQTLSKVLCAVVKFSNDQQRQIVEHEDRKQNLLREKLRLEKEIRRLSTKS